MKSTESFLVLNIIFLGFWLTGLFFLIFCIRRLSLIKREANQNKNKKNRKGRLSPGIKIIIMYINIVWISFWEILVSIFWIREVLSFLR